MSDDLRTRAREAAEEPYRKPRWHVGTVTDRLIEAFCEGFHAHAAQQPSREEILDLADWHETKAEKAVRFRPEVDGENRVMDKAAEIPTDAARRLRKLLTGASDE